jgi:hypothetical protein
VNTKREHVSIKTSESPQRLGLRANPATSSKYTIKGTAMAVPVAVSKAIAAIRFNAFM